MDIVLGVSMAPTTVRMVLVEGQNADGATVDEDGFEVTAVGGSATSSAPDRVLAAILGTRESAAQGDFQLTSTGVTWTDPVEAAALRDALAAHKVENVMLVSAFLAAAALAQAVGSAVGYAHTGLLFLEPDTATLAIVDCADGSVVDVRRQPIHWADASVELTNMVARLNALESPPDGVFVVGSGVDIAPIKPRLEAVTALPVSGPEEPEMALAHGAALASANAPLFASSTAALAYAQVPDWTTAGVVDPFAAAPDTADAPFEDADRGYGAGADPDFLVDEEGHARKLFLVALSVMTIFFVGVLALVISLAVSIRPTASQRPSATGNLIVPAKQVPAPVQAPPAAPPLPSLPQVAPEVPQAPPAAAPAPAPQAPAHPPVGAVPVPVPAPVVVAPAPRAPAPVPEAPVPVPVPVAPPPQLPLPLEVPGLPLLPQILNPPVQVPPNPGGVEHHGDGWPGGGNHGGDGLPGLPGGGNQGGDGLPGLPGGGNQGGGWPFGGGHGGEGGFGGDHGGFGGDHGGFGGDHGGLGGFGGDHGGLGGFGGGHGGFGGFGRGLGGGHGGGHR